MNEKEFEQMEEVQENNISYEEPLGGSKTAVTPIGDFNAQSFPIDPDNVYYITKNELDALGRHELKWSSETYMADEPVYEESVGEFGEVIKTQVGTRAVEKTRPILVENDPTEENARNAAIERIAELKKSLADTDYEAVKFAEGAMTAQEFEPYRINRAAWRAEINQLQETYGLAD